MQFLAHKLRTQFSSSTESIRDEQFKFHKHILAKIDEQLVSKTELSDEIRDFIRFDELTSIRDRLAAIEELINNQR